MVHGIRHIWEGEVEVNGLLNCEDGEQFGVGEGKFLWLALLRDGARRGGAVADAKGWLPLPRR